MLGFVQIYVAIALLGSASYKERVKAKHDLIISTYSFKELQKVYKTDFVQKDPETKENLKNVLYIRFRNENEYIYVEEWSGEVNEKLLRIGFEQSLRW